MKLSRTTTASLLVLALAVTLCAPMVFGYQTGRFIVRATMNEALYFMAAASAVDTNKTGTANVHNDEANAAFGRLKGWPVNGRRSMRRASAPRSTTKSSPVDQP